MSKTPQKDSYVKGVAVIVIVA